MKSNFRRHILFIKVKEMYREAPFKTSRDEYKSEDAASGEGEKKKRKIPFFECFLKV